MDFGMTTQTAEGYMEEDTAGQTNIFPTIAKPYEAGTGDTTAEKQTNSLAAIGAAVAVVAIVAGLLLVKGSGDTSADEALLGQLRTLSEYRALFASQL